VLKRQIGALEETSSEELELPGKEQIPTNNQTFYLDEAKITPSTQEGNPGTSTTIHTDMKTGLTINTFLPSKKLCNDQTH
jgi:hypothetical protein